MTEDRRVPDSREFRPLVTHTQLMRGGEYECKLPGDKVSREIARWREMDSTRVPGWMMRLFQEVK